MAKHCPNSENTANISIFEQCSETENIWPNFFPNSFPINQIICILLTFDHQTVFRLRLGLRLGDYGVAGPDNEQLDECGSA